MRYSTQNGVKYTDSSIRADTNRKTQRYYLPKNYKFNVFSGDPVFLKPDGTIGTLGEKFITFYNEIKAAESQTAQDDALKKYVQTPILGIVENVWLPKQNNINFLRPQSQGMDLSSQAGNFNVGVNVITDPTSIWQFKMRLENAGRRADLLKNIGFARFAPAFEVLQAEDEQHVLKAININGSQANGGGTSAYLTDKIWGTTTGGLTGVSLTNWVPQAFETTGATISNLVIPSMPAGTYVTSAPRNGAISTEIGNVNGSAGAAVNTYVPIANLNANGDAHKAALAGTLNNVAVTLTSLLPLYYQMPFSYVSPSSGDEDGENLPPLNEWLAASADSVNLNVAINNSAIFKAFFDAVQA